MERRRACALSKSRFRSVFKARRKWAHKSLRNEMGVINCCGDAVPEVVYVSDAGKIETVYWNNTLRRFCVDGRRPRGGLLRSIAKMRELRDYKASASDKAAMAERYLRRYHRFMDYAAMRSRGYPIGSGVVESACHQIVNERMKLSGMRWHKQGGQRTMTLRCLLLSGI